MVVSDSGLADNEPTWCNGSPWACVLIGLQPRGGWQVLQRCVQWGDDRLARAFGVQCPKVALYAYFACSLRNRLEVWDSSDFWSPMQGPRSGTTLQWASRKGFDARRPTKLLDGAKGGQAFLCDILIPEKGSTYSIDEQALMQLRSVALVVAATMSGDSSTNTVFRVFEDDFGFCQRLSPVFIRLAIGLTAAQLLATSLAITVLHSIWKESLIFGQAISYVLKLSSLFLWAVGATGLLMLGGNPRVCIFTRPLPAQVQRRLDDLRQGRALQCTVTVKFGSLHGSGFVLDQGSCDLPFSVVDKICRWDMKTTRTGLWFCGFAFFGCNLLLSVIMQVAGNRVSTLGSEILGIALLLSTAVARGIGLSAPEEWMIPKWKTRTNSRPGAVLLGRIHARV